MCTFMDRLQEMRHYTKVGVDCLGGAMCGEACTGHICLLMMLRGASAHSSLWISLEISGYKARRNGGEIIVCGKSRQKGFGL